MKWLRMVLEELYFTQASPSILWGDNQADITWTLGAGNARAAKHIDMRSNFGGEAAKKCNIKFEYKESAKIDSDILKKILLTLELRRRRKRLNFPSNESIYIENCGIEAGTVCLQHSSSHENGRSFCEFVTPTLIFPCNSFCQRVA